MRRAPEDLTRDMGYLGFGRQETKSSKCSTLALDGSHGYDQGNGHRKEEILGEFAVYGSYGIPLHMARRNEERS
jgi:hypothetical protein